ncbi:cutinase, partial [Aureobasidium melanogenum]
GGLGGASSSGSAGSSDSSSTGTATSGFGSLGSLSSLTGAAGAVPSNDVTGNTGCKKVTFIFARGTTEMGTLGSIVGPGLASALIKDTGSCAVQGVDYPADAAGNANMGASGGPKMAALATQALKQCPDTKIILGGYSQGAMVVHNALGSIDGSKIAAVTAFGDPMNGQSFKGVDDSKVVRYCGSSDFVCDLTGKTQGTGSHLSYGSNLAEAASRLSQIVGVKA